MYFKNRLGLWSARWNREKWKLSLNFFKHFNDIGFDQYLFADQNNFVSIELHGYCDASKTAYSAVTDARTICKDKMTVKFVSAKSKVVSIKACQFRE